MLGIATDGYYCPHEIVYRSLGGAEGGVPARADLRPARPEILTREQVPDLVSDGLEPSTVAQSEVDLRPQLTSRLLRPTMVSEDDDPC